MSAHEIFCFLYSYFMDAQTPLLKKSALYFDKLVILNPVGASWATIGVVYPAREPIRQVKR